MTDYIPLLQTALWVGLLLVAVILFRETLRHLLRPLIAVVVVAERCCITNVTIPLGIPLGAPSGDGTQCVCIVISGNPRRPSRSDRRGRMTPEEKANEREALVPGYETHPDAIGTNRQVQKHLRSDEVDWTEVHPEVAKELGLS